eukprot:TRINITY_DN797_c0_g1_i4.p1 TRINITY_DN797_c0_g1~~TRINITY_DN797_c0_g1_i4.p1  ORF type:complete len:170 (-),score=35.09 TRINITY_DN797_c0_g1_i4:216-725(-)
MCIRDRYQRRVHGIQRMQIGIRLSTGKVITIDVTESMRLIKLKELIKDKSNIPVDQQKLIFIGEPMDDDEKTLSEYGVSKEDTIYLVMMFAGGEQIIIKTMTGKSYPITISTDETIESLKRLIKMKTGMPTDQQKLLYNGVNLTDDKKKIKDYGITTESIIHLIFILKG